MVYPPDTKNGVTFRHRDIFSRPEIYASLKQIVSQCVSDCLARPYHAGLYVNGAVNRIVEKLRPYVNEADYMERTNKTDFENGG